MKPFLAWKPIDENVPRNEDIWVGMWVVNSVVLKHQPMCDWKVCLARADDGDIKIWHNGKTFLYTHWLDGLVPFDLMQTVKRPPYPGEMT